MNKRREEKTREDKTGQEKRREEKREDIARQHKTRQDITRQDKTDRTSGSGKDKQELTDTNIKKRFKANSATREDKYNNKGTALDKSKDKNKNEDNQNKP
jgi:hypothetical protein